MKNKSTYTDQVKKLADIILTQNIFDKNISLLGGYAGISIFLFYYARYFDDPKVSELAADLIDKSFESINNGSLYHPFAGGLAGVGWGIEFLEQNQFIDCDTDETIGVLDDFLYERMLFEFDKKEYDYLHGASGIALYFLKRKKSEKIKKYLYDYVEKLEKLSIKQNDSIVWKSKILIDKALKKSEIVYNLGVSHGISSLISILGKIHKLGINQDKAERLIDGAVNYLFSQVQDTSKYYSYFPNHQSIDKETKQASRLAWCYGDLGIAAILQNTAKTIDNKDLEQKAIDILHYSTKRKDLSQNYVVDAGLCHGSAGIAHIFYRMYKNTDDKKFLTSAEYWYQETMKMATYEDSNSGFKAYRSEDYGGWKEEFGFLEGISGIGLSLLSYIFDIDPEWDEILLLN